MYQIMYFECFHFLPMLPSIDEVFISRLGNPFYQHPFKY